MLHWTEVPLFHAARERAVPSGADDVERLTVLAIWRAAALPFGWLLCSAGEYFAGVDGADLHAPRWSPGDVAWSGFEGAYAAVLPPLVTREQLRAGEVGEGLYLAALLSPPPYVEALDVREEGGALTGLWCELGGDPRGAPFPLASLLDR